jgi:hypothetical protein
MSQTDSTNTTGVSGVGGEGLYLPTDVTAEQIFQAIGRLRKEARDEIDRLVRFLDETENHMELEPEDEADDSDHEDGADDEDSLGSLERHASSYGPDGPNPTGSQTNWAGGRGDDLEDEHDGAEPPEDAEPSLGAFEGHEHQNVAWAGKTFVVDAELDRAEESGIGDLDGLHEQTPPLDWLDRGMV